MDLESPVLDTPSPTVLRAREGSTLSAAGLEKLVFGGVLLVCAARLFDFVQANSHSLYDDAYIYLRYVDNILAGCGPAFNCGQMAVEGFTSPLYLALLTLLSFLLGGDGPMASQVLGVLTVGGTLVSIAALGRTRALREALPSAPLVSLAAALILAFEPHFLLNSVIGLDASLAALLVTAVFHAALHPELRGLRTLLLLAVLARPECALLILAAPVLPQTRRRDWLMPLVASLLGVELLRIVVFRDLLPNTFWAKSGGTLEHLQLGVRYVADTFIDFPSIALAPLALFLIPSSASMKLRRPIQYTLVVSACWFLFYLRSGGDLFFYSRLSLPLIPVLTLLGVFGFADLVRRVTVDRRVAIAAPLCVALAFVFVGREHALIPSHGFEKVLRWAELGRFLRDTYPGARIATVPLGAIGYFSGLPTIDLVGLTEPAIAHAGRSVPSERLVRNWIGHERHNTEWVLSEQPQVIVMSKFQDHPWDRLEEARAGFYAEWLILQEIKAGRTEYQLCDAPIGEGLHWLLFVRGPCLGDA